MKEKIERLNKLQKLLIDSLNGYSFKELENLLNINYSPVTREAIMQAMEKYHKKEYDVWIGN